MTADAQILADLLAMVDELAGDWEYDGEVTPHTYFLADMGLESLDLVVLGTMIQHRYGRLPFAEYLAEIGERPVAERDVTIAELVVFIAGHRTPAGVGAADR
jgi:acyl carrier protein